MSTSDAVNVAGTNTTIGGDTLGSWTNNAGGALAPTNVGVTGGTLRHANLRVTMDTYVQAVSDEKHKAQSRVVKDASAWHSQNSGLA